MESAILISLIGVAVQIISSIVIAKAEAKNTVKKATEKKNRPSRK